jgi:hypothetical protein
MENNSNSSQNSNTESLSNSSNFGLWVVLGLFALAFALGFLVFKNYMRSETSVTSALSDLKQKAPSMSIEQCAQNNMEWYLKCDAMQQICDDTVTRMMKVCLVLGDKSAQCSSFGNEIFGYNFGVKQCAPYLKIRNQKKACADTWQTIADFCKSTQKFKSGS